ncbi:Retrovirus-related Pol polyprotein from type-2 retrotransposable element R2DM; Endonuclease [Eumeta japonica]|uniref:Retrovirus-related Pol polyprotein from type-2 retrotransposable element R2DM Endonuclease n=1 Tax=Eumeta variegata TaxID=151549 RepID=A0A4C1WRU0_EUMVA|nr:Retrovirus-related Pol polyprotein from type-2 retrotransposable element R2DM; Endonuclease [Eumeta japonica]
MFLARMAARAARAGSAPNTPIHQTALTVNEGVPANAATTPPLVPGNKLLLITIRRRLDLVQIGTVTSSGIKIVNDAKSRMERRYWNKAKLRTEPRPRRRTTFAVAVVKRTFSGDARHSPSAHGERAHFGCANVFRRVIPAELLREHRCRSPPAPPPPPCRIKANDVLSPITSTLDENQPKEQAGFRSKYSTVDHIHVLRQILQKYNEYNKKYYLGFVDYNKAFDSLEHDYIWEALRSQGVQEKYIRILMNIYSKSTAPIRLKTTGEEFPIEKGVRQGDPVSPKLFSAALEMIFRNLDWNKNGLNINGENLNH